MRANDARAMGVTQASVPPASITSALPSRIRRAASPTAWVPDVQAVQMQKLGPVHPSFMATNPAVAFAIIMGTRNGDTREAPRRNSSCSCSSWVMRPPTPVPTTTPQRAGSAPGSPAPARASAAAPKPSWATRSVRRASL